jgi:hypothetical protein
MFFLLPFNTASSSWYFFFWNNVDPHLPCFQVSDCSTFRILHYVSRIAVIFGEPIECFWSIVSKIFF